MAPCSLSLFCSLILLSRRMRRHMIKSIERNNDFGLHVFFSLLSRHYSPLSFRLPIFNNFTWTFFYSSLLRFHLNCSWLEIFLSRFRINYAKKLNLFSQQNFSIHFLWSMNALSFLHSIVVSFDKSQTLSVDFDFSFKWRWNIIVSFGNDKFLFVEVNYNSKWSNSRIRFCCV